MKKLILSISAIMLLSVSVFAEEIEIWTTDTQTERMKVQELIADTWAAISGNTYKLVPVPENELSNRLAAAKTAGKMPDVVGVNFERFLDKDISKLINYKAVESTINKIGRDRFYPGTLDFAQVGSNKNKHYLVPYYGWSQSIWYRKDWFDKEGLAAPTDWDSVMAAAKKFHDPKNNKYGILLGTHATEPFTTQVFTQIAMSNNAYVIDKNGRLKINSNEMKEALKYYTDLAQYTPPGQQYWRGRDYYLQGHMAMFFYSTFIMDDLALEEVASGSLTGENFEGLKGGKFDPELVKNTEFAPTITKKSTVAYGRPLGITIFNTTPARGEAASDFIAFMSQPDNVIPYVHTGVGGMIPVFKDVLEDERFLDDPKGVYKRYGSEKIGQIVEGMANANTFSTHNGKNFPEAATIESKLIINEMITKVLYDGVSVDDAVEEAHEAAKKLLDSN